MKCNGIRVISKRTKRTLGTYHQDVKLEELQSLHRGIMSGDAYVDRTPCDGQVHVRISAIAEPFFGGSSPTLDVTFYCEKCHRYRGPAPFNEHTLDVWVNAHLDKLS